MKSGCLKGLLGVVGIAIVAVVLLRIFQPKPPQGERGEVADRLARQMMAAVNCDAWNETPWVRWSFAGHRYVWDKQRNLLQAEWGDNKVLLLLDNQQGLAYVSNQLVSGKKADKLRGKAWTFFCNDSFWLNPVCKAFDPGTERIRVELDNGEKGVAVTYTSGGVTPGDTYLWELDEQYRPKRWRMWVKILPVGGIPADWVNWRQLPGGAWIAGQRSLGPMKLAFDDVTTASDWQQLQLDTDPFLPLLQQKL